MVIGSIKRLSKVARDFNVGISTIVDFLHRKGFDIDTNPNNKITDDAFHLLEKEYKGDISLKKESELINLKSHRNAKESLSLDDVKDSGHKHVSDDYEDDEVIIKGNMSIKAEPVIHTEPKPIRHEHKEEMITTIRQEIEAPKVIGKIDLNNLGGVKKKEEPVIAVEKPKPAPQKPIIEDQPVKEVIKEVVKEVEEVKPAVEPKEEIPVPAAKHTAHPKHVTPVEPVAETLEKINTDNKSFPKLNDTEEPVRVITEEDRFSSDILTTNVPKVEEVKVVGRIDLALLNQKTRPAKKSKKQKEEERKDREKVRRDVQNPAEDENNQPKTTDTEKTGPTITRAKVERLSGPTVVGKIDLPTDRKPPVVTLASDPALQAARKKKRKRISKDIPGNQRPVNVADKTAVPGERRKLVVTKSTGAAAPGGDKNKLKKRPLLKREVSEEDVQKQIKDTLARLTTKGTKSKGSKYRKDKRQVASDRMAAQAERDEADQNILKVTEFVSVNELATMMDTSVTSVISTCFHQSTSGCRNHGYCGR